MVKNKRVIRDRSTGLRFMFIRNLAHQRKVFIDLCGNSNTVVMTPKGALKLAKMLEATAKTLRNKWAAKIEN